MRADIAIITIREDEFSAVFDRLEKHDVKTVSGASGRTYAIFLVPTRTNKDCTVALARSPEQGNDISQQVASDMIRDLDPQLLLVVGIAGGVPHNDFTLGDVIVSSRIDNFNLNTVDQGITTYNLTGGVHPLVSNITASLGMYRSSLVGWNEIASIGIKRPLVDLSQAQTNVYGDTKWRDEVLQSLNIHFGESASRSPLPLFKTGLIASSDNLIKDTDILTQWLKSTRNVLAFEMESAGVLRAVQQMNKQSPAMAIRGISDIIGLKRDAHWTSYACQSAAAFTYAFIRTGIIEPRAQDSTTLTKSINIFYSYSYKDKKLQEELDSYLAILKKSGLIQTWSDREILPGSSREQEINFHLNSADIILFLLSPDFFASDYIDSVEVQLVMKRVSRGEARVIPIIIRQIDLHNTPFSSLQILPRNGIAITNWKNREEAFIEISKEIRGVIESLQASRVSEVNWEDKGDRFMQLTQYEDALDAYDRALRLNPNSATAPIGKGNALAGLNKPVEALVSYEMALRLNPADVTVYIKRGNVFRELGRFSEALASYDQALRLNPDNYIPYLEKGQTLYHLQRFSEAMDAYDRAIQLAPGYAPAYIGRGTAAIGLAQYDQALANFNVALQLNPKSVEAHFLKGEVLLQLDRDEPAYEAFLQAVRLDSRYTPAYLEMGKALRQMHRDQEALAAYDTAIVLDPGDARAYQIKAIILHELRRDDEARLALYQARDRGLNVENDTALQMILNAEVTEVALSQTRIDSVRQFLANAGFDIQTTSSKVGLLAHAKKSDWKMWFHKGLYIRILFDSQLDQRTVESIAYDARKHRCDYALVIINQQPMSSGWGQINILRGEPGPSRFTCLPIDEALIQESIAINNEFHNLKKYIEHRLGNGFDPYDELLPVTGVVNFYGRQLIAEELMDDLQHRKLAGLFGMHKMGKSSVLKELQLRATFPVAYVYLSAGEGLGDIYKRILEDWTISGRVKYPDFRWKPPQTMTASVSQSEFYMVAKDLLSYLDTLNTATSLLAIFFDEIDRIVPAEGDEKTMELYIHLMDSLRGLHQETQSLSLLVAGLYPRVARDNYFWGIHKNPMHQIIKEYFLPPLDDDDCTNMILSLGGQANVQYEKSALDYIIEMSGSHPLLSRKICSYACKKLYNSGPITVDIVDEVVREFVRDPQKNAYFGENGLWKELSQPSLWGDEVSNANHHLLLRLAQEDKMSEEDLCSGQNQAVTIQAFYVLKERSIISSPDNSGYYHITFGLFKNWIRFRQLGLM